MRSRDTYNMLLPYFAYLRLLGLLPFSVNLVSSKITIIVNLKVTLAKLVALNVLFYVCSQNVLKSFTLNGYGKIQNFLGTWLVICTLTFTNILTTASLRSKKTLEKALNGLLKLEQNMEPFNDPRSRVVMMALVWSCKSWALLIMLIIQYGGTTYLDYLHIIPYLFCIYFDTFVTFLYGVPMITIKRRFKLLNNFLKTKNSGAGLRELRITHADLCRSAQLFHESFQLHVLLRLGTLFFTLNYTYFYLYKTIIKENGENSALLRIYDLSFDFSEVCILSYIGGSTSKEVGNLDQNPRN